MKKTWITVGIVAAAAGALYYPSLLLYRFIMRKREEMGADDQEGGHTMKAFLPAYRGKHKPHHRHAPNGQANTH